MIYSIATRKITAFLFAIMWFAFFGQGTSYSQPPVEAGKIYWTHPERGIHRSSLDGSNVEQLVKPEWSYPGDIALDVAGGKMYWTDKRGGGVDYWTWRARGGIYRSTLDGTNVEVLLGDKWIETPLGDEQILYLSESRSSSHSIALDVAGGKMYWTQEISHGDYRDGIVARANLDGSNSEALFLGSHPRDIALDLVRDKVYWTDSGRILRDDLDDPNRGNREDYEYDEYDEILSGFSSTLSIALDVEGGKMYWTDAETIRRADLDGQNIEEVLTVLDGYPEEINLDVDQGKIYWTNPGTQTIQRADLDGENREILFDLEDDVKHYFFGPRAGIALDVEGGKMYWTDAGPGTIQRADLDGENREILFDPIVREPYGIALGMNEMYWTDVVKGTILQADLNGKNLEVLLTGLNRPTDITLLDGTKIYWAEWGIGKIKAADLDGSQVEDIATGLDYPKIIALNRDSSKMYWANRDTVFRSNLDGSHFEKIATVQRWYGWYSAMGLDFSDIALDVEGAKMYWTNQDTIFRSDLDGSHFEKIATVQRWYGWNQAVALDPVGGKIYWTKVSSVPSLDSNYPESAAAGIVRSNLDGSNVEGIYFMRTYSHSAPTDIALYIPHPTSVSTLDTTPAIPTTSGLSPNFPNPFNASTQIAYRLAIPGPVRLTIYNTLGQPVRTLVDQFQAASSYQVRWDAHDQRGTALAAGVYLVRLHYPGGEQTRRLLLLK